MGLQRGCSDFHALPTTSARPPVTCRSCRKRTLSAGTNGRGSREFQAAPLGPTFILSCGVTSARQLWAFKMRIGRDSIASAYEARLSACVPAFLPDRARPLAGPARPDRRFHPAVIGMTRCLRKKTFASRRGYRCYWGVGPRGFDTHLCAVERVLTACGHVPHRPRRSVSGSAADLSRRRATVRNMAAQAKRAFNETLVHADIHRPDVPSGTSPASCA